MKERERPIELIAHERLLLRLPKHHEKYSMIEERAYQMGAGYAGEAEVDRILPEIGLPDGTHIFKDIMFEFIQHHFIQIDTLIVTPTCIIILEIKKYAAGTIEFNEEIGKTIRVTTTQQTENFDCVVDQVDRTVYGLDIVLQQLHIKLPIYPIIVLANQKTNVLQYPKTFPLKYKKQLPRYIRSLLKTTPLIEQHNHKQTIHKLNKRIYRKTYQPLCARYEIPLQEIIHGVICPQCNEILPYRKNKCWYCTTCNQQQPTAIANSLLDYVYLIGKPITNQSARAFLNIPNPKAMHYLLTKPGIIKYGKKRGTYYQMKI